MKILITSGKIDTSAIVQLDAYAIVIFLELFQG
jgi:hypothetical protein